MGVNERTIPVQGAEGWTTISVVLVAGDIGDYAAYVGIGAPEWIAAHGNKISFAEACEHFPGGQLQIEKYRP